MLVIYYLVPTIFMVNKDYKIIKMTPLSGGRV